MSETNAQTDRRALRTKCWSTEQTGAVAPIAAMLMVPIIGMAGIAVDYGRARTVETELQAALDASVLAAAKVQPGDAKSVLQTYFNQNFKSGIATSKALGEPVVTTTSVSATATAKVRTTLAQVLGITEMSVGVTAVANAAEFNANAGKACVLVLSPTANQSLLVNSGARVNTNCEIHVKSTADPAAIFNSNLHWNTLRTCIQGKKIIENEKVNPGKQLQLDCPTADNPYVNKLPTPASATCTVSNANYNGGEITLNPGVYCGWINFNNNVKVTFKPGVYVIKDGGWNVSGGDWVGTGVTFYFADTSKIQFNSAVKADMKAPTSGLYADLFMYEKEGLPKSQFVIDDNRGYDFTGMMYLPSRDMTWNSGTSMSAQKSFTLIVNTLILNSQVRWHLNPDNKAVMLPGAITNRIARITK